MLGWRPLQSPGRLQFDDSSDSSPIVIAGPCSIESEDQILKMCRALSDRVTYMRGGVFRAGTYPPSLFGLQSELLKHWSFIAKQYNLKIIVEVLDYTQLETLDDYADAFQVGARAMQNYTLLRLLSNQNKTVSIKRHPGATLDEFLGACEYLLSGKGHTSPILIERGSSTHMRHVRWDLSVSTIAAIKRLTQVPIIVDASHGSGRRDLVESLTLSGIAAGADGFLVEVHPDPERSLSDADQAISIDGFDRLRGKADRIYRYLNLCR